MDAGTTVEECPLMKACCHTLSRDLVSGVNYKPSLQSCAILCHVMYEHILQPEVNAVLLVVMTLLTNMACRMCPKY